MERLRFDWVVRCPKCANEGHVLGGRFRLTYKDGTTRQIAPGVDVTSFGESGVDYLLIQCQVCDFSLEMECADADRSD